MIKTAGGLGPIERLTEDMLIYTKNELTNDVELKKVLKVHINSVTLDLCKVYIDNDVIESTSGHNYYEKSKGWIAAKDLKVGDILVTSDNQEKIVKKVELIKNISNEKHTVYNLTVEDNHNYYVGNNSVLVHNVPS